MADAEADAGEADGCGNVAGSPDGGGDAATSPKRAPSAAVEDVHTSSRKRKLPRRAEALEAAECAAAEEEDEDAQSDVDRALAAFAAAHKLDVDIFCSDEWEALLEAANQGPLPSLVSCDELTPAVLLARASIHQNQVRLGASAGMSE
jgi:hypothetical protein